MTEMPYSRCRSKFFNLYCPHSVLWLYEMTVSVPRWSERVGTTVWRTAQVQSEEIFWGLDSLFHFKMAPREESQKQNKGKTPERTFD